LEIFNCQARITTQFRARPRAAVFKTAMPQKKQSAMDWARAKQLLS